MKSVTFETQRNPILRVSVGCPRDGNGNITVDGNYMNRTSRLFLGLTKRVGRSHTVDDITSPSVKEKGHLGTWGRRSGPSRGSNPGIVSMR